MGKHKTSAADIGLAVMQTRLREDPEPYLTHLREGELIKVTQGVMYPNLYGFKYMPGAERYGVVVAACRGLVLDRDDNWEVAARPYDRFFNVEEGVDNLDWGTAVIMPKLDGSLIYVYRHDGKILCGTTGHPEAAGPLDGTGKTFADLFWEVVAETNLRGYADDHGTLMFELCTPENVNVIRQREYRATLLAARNNATGKYLDEVALDRLAQALDVAVIMQGHPRSIPVHRRLRDCLEAVELMEPGESEGFVVKDAQHRMVKIKAPSYIGLHRLKHHTTPTALIEAAKEGALDSVAEVCVEYLPEVNARIAEFRAKWDAMVKAIGECWQAWLVSQEDSDPDPDMRIDRAKAAEVFKTAPAPAAMFALYDGKVTDAEEWMRQQSEAHIRRLLDV